MPIDEPLTRADLIELAREAQPTRQTGGALSTPEQATATAPASPAREGSRIARELHETYAVVGAAMDLLYAVSGGSVHPALRQARRCGDDALELAEHARTLLDQGIAQLCTDADGQRVHTIEDVTDALTSVRTRLGTVAEQITALPQRIATAQALLAGTEQPDSSTETIAHCWDEANAQLRLMAASLTDAVRALSTYTADVTGTGGDA